MNRLFGRGKPAEPGPSISDATKSVETRVQNLEAKVNNLEKELLKYKTQLSKMREGPAKQAVRQKAMRILKQKKIYDNQLDNLRNQCFNMEQVQFTNQTLEDTRTTVVAMKDGMKKMEKEFKNIKIDEIDDLQDSLADMMAYADEVQESLSRPAYLDDVDIDDLDAELDALGDEIALDEDTSYLDEVMNAPAAPKDTTEVEAKTEEEKGRVPVDEFGLPQLKTHAK